MFIPECEGNRVDYAARQCFDIGRSFCACAAINGTMLTDWRDNLQACNCVRAQQVARQGQNIHTQIYDASVFIDAAKVFGIRQLSGVQGPIKMADAFNTPHAVQLLYYIIIAGLSCRYTH